MELDFSIVVPAFDLWNSLELVLRCLDAQSFPKERFECIVVDDGPADETRLLLEHRRTIFAFRPILNDDSTGRGAARNAGWRKAVGKIVIFLDGDNLPSPDWLASYADAMLSEFYGVARPKARATEGLCMRDGLAIRRRQDDATQRSTGFV